MDVARGVTFVNCTGDTFTPTHSGAISTWVFEMVRQAREHGVRAPVITRDSPHPSYDLDDVHFLSYPRLPANRVAAKVVHRQRLVTGWDHDGQKAWAERVAAKIAELGLERDVLVLNNDAVLAVFLARRFPGAIVAQNFQNQNVCHPRFRRAFAERVQLPMAVSRYTATWAEEHFSKPEGSVRTLHSGVDAGRFSPRPPGTPGAGGTHRIVNFVGLTNANKGIDTLLESVLVVAGSRDDVAVQICGTSHYGYDVPDEFGSRLDRLADRLRAVGVPVDRPGFVGRADLPARLAGADVHVVPSRWPEPFGLVALEGMASGLATVVSRSGGLPEVVGDAALLFDPGDVDGLAGHLTTLLGDDGIRQDYARRARRRAEAMGWDRTWETLVGHLADLGAPVQVAGG